MSKVEFDVLGGWVVHIIGPDDVIPQPNELAALRESNGINKALLKIERMPNDPFVVAVAKNTQTEEL